MNEPWLSDPIVGAQPGGSPAIRPLTQPRPDPYKVEDQQMQRETAARAQARFDYQRERDRKNDADDAAKANAPPKAPNSARIPAAAAAGIQENLKTLRSLDDAIKELKTRPESIGPGTGVLGDTFTQFNDPAGTPTRAAVGAVGAYKIHDLSGAAVSASEAPRFVPFVPAVGDRPEVAEVKLKKFREALAGQLSEQFNFYGPANGYIAYQSPESAAFQNQGEATGPRMTPEQTATLDALISSGATADQIRAFGDSINFRMDNADDIVAARDKGQGVAPADQAAYAVPEQTQRIVDELGPAGASDLFKQGAVLGLGDQAAGIGNAAANVITSPFTDAPFDPVGAYQSGRDAENIRLNEARGRLGAGGTALELGGALFSGNVSNALKVVPTLLGRIGQGASGGAVGGGIAGFGYGEGINSLATGAAGAGLGAGLGAMLPIAGQVIGNRIGGLRRLTGRDPALPRRLVNEAMEADANTPAAAGRIMDDAAGRGSPMMLADTGDNARGLLASVGRQPGASQRLTRQAVGDRQMAQGERMSAAVVRDLGPTANIRDMGESLVEMAKTASRPLYKKFEAAPGASSVKLDDLAERPSFLKALYKATETAAEEGTDPASLGFQLNAAGEVELSKIPSFKTLDAIKKGMDDVIEKFRNPITGRLDLSTGEARATNATLRTLIARIDKVNLHYAPARAAYAGPAKMKDALEKGAKALSKSPDDIMATMKNMGDSEQESFRLGVRKAIVDLIGSKKDGGDKVSALIGTPKSRAALTRVFGGRREFERFIATLRDEQAMGQTYGAVYGNSATAGRAAFDATTNDTGLAESAVDAALRGGKDGMWSAAVSAVQKLRDVSKFGAGQAGERTRESIAALLSETDPATLRELIAAAREASRQQAALAGRQSRRAARVGRDVGVATGMTTGSFSGPRK